MRIYTGTDNLTEETKNLVGKKITKVENNFEADEGLRITFDDNTILQIGYNGGEGSIEINEKHYEKI